MFLGIVGKYSVGSKKSSLETELDIRPNVESANVNIIQIIINYYEKTSFYDISKLILYKRKYRLNTTSTILSTFTVHMFH